MKYKLRDYIVDAWQVDLNAEAQPTWLVEALSEGDIRFGVNCFVVRRDGVDYFAKQRTWILKWPFASSPLPCSSPYAVMADHLFQQTYEPNPPPPTPSATAATIAPSP